MRGESEPGSIRNRVERFFNRLKRYRCLAPRYEKWAENYVAIIILADIVL